VFTEPPATFRVLLLYSEILNADPLGTRSTVGLVPFACDNQSDVFANPIITEFKSVLMVVSAEIKVV